MNESEQYETLMKGFMAIKMNQEDMLKTLSFIENYVMSSDFRRWVILFVHLHPDPLAIVKLEDMINDNLIFKISNKKQEAETFRFSEN